MKDVVREVERPNIHEALRRIGGNQTVLSETLQTSYKNLLKEIMMYELG